LWYFLYPSGSPFKFVKERVDEVDNANFKYNYTVIEGDVLGDKLEKVSHELKIVAAPGGGSIVKISSKFHAKGDHEVNAEEMKGAKEMAEKLLRAVESYLLAHTAEYN
jgi:hypothetical protein